MTHERTHGPVVSALSPSAYLSVHGLVLDLELLALVSGAGGEAYDNGPLVCAQPLHGLAKVLASLLLVKVGVRDNGAVSKLQRKEGRR